MENFNLDTIVENLISLQPILGKTMSKLEQCDDMLLSLSRQHMITLFVLDKIGVAPVSEIGNKLNISKPQMTLLTDKLIEHNLIQRIQDKNDRRIINISLSKEGSKLITEFKATIKKNAREKLSSLDDKDLRELSGALEKVKTLLSKTL